MVVRHVPAVDGGTHTTTIVIASGNDILLYRSIEGSGEASAESVMDDVHSSLVFYEDNFGAKLTTVYFDGIPLEAALVENVREHTGTNLQSFPTVTSGQSLSGDSLSSGALAPLKGVLLG